MSHYTVLDSIDGYRRRTANEYTFGLRTVDGRALYFEAATGEHAAGQSIEAK